MYAINKAGGIVNVLHPLTPPKALRENLEGKNCKILFYFDNFCKKAQNELSNWQGKVIVCSASDYLKGIEFFGMSVRDIFHPSRYLPSKQFILYRKTIKNNKLKANFPETKIRVDAGCCAGVTPESHRAALATMKMCQIDVIE